MQYPVPQFTDVEDKIIGSLSIKQFGILFAVGIVIFLAYSTTKSLLVAAFFFVLFGIPGLAVAFGKINGRKLYQTFPFVIKFITSPKVLVFYKEANRIGGQAQFKNVEIKPEQQQAPLSREDSQTRLAAVNKLLEQQRQQEAELLNRG